MTLVRRPSPIGELVSLRQAMDRLSPTIDDQSTNGGPAGTESGTAAKAEA